MLNKCQEKALDALLEFCYSQEKFICLSGMPGTGKTYLLKEFASQLGSINTVLRIAGRSPFSRIEFTATTNKASAVLCESSGISATTIYKLFGIKVTSDYKTGEDKLDYTRAISVCDCIIVVDEASMLTEEMFGAMMQALSKSKRIIFVGDPNQLPPIGAGRPFVDMVHLLREDLPANPFPRVCKSYGELTVNRRQASEDERADVRLARQFTGGVVEDDDEARGLLSLGR